MMKNQFFFSNCFNCQKFHVNASQGSGPRGTLLGDTKIKTLFQKELSENPSFEKCSNFQ